MIPKIIHYCWFGEGEIPQLAKNCIESWKKILPEYELRLWNEDNFDVSSNRYTCEAYNMKKFAFVTDYVRLYAIYNFGGIYMDTDVQVLKKLDQFLVHPAFSGFETEHEIPTGIIGGKKNSEWIGGLLKSYNSRCFILSSGRLDLTTNVETISESMKNSTFQFNNTTQDYNGIVTIYSKEYFCPKSYLTGKIELTENTFCIHHFAGSWLSPSQKIKKKIMKLVSPKLIIRYKKLRSRLLKNKEG